MTTCTSRSSSICSPQPLHSERCCTSPSKVFSSEHLLVEVHLEAHPALGFGSPIRLERGAVEAVGVWRLQYRGLLWCHPVVRPGGPLREIGSTIRDGGGCEAEQSHAALAVGVPRQRAVECGLGEDDNVAGVSRGLVEVLGVSDSILSAQAGKPLKHPIETQQLELTQGT